ncbi:MAG TPA: GtrA family protein [Vicinamibacterales bacterium]|nr:GtrA family protein [Vicinamibacterales bacterium]
MTLSCLDITARRFARFNVVSALGMGVQLLVLAVLVGPADVGYLPATAIAVGTTVLHNFVWHWIWTWRDRPRGRPMTALAAFVGANGSVSFVTNLVVMTGLVSGVGLRPVVANLCAIAAAGLVNFGLADRWVFSSRRDACDANLRSAGRTLRPGDRCIRA